MKPTPNKAAQNENSVTLAPNPRLPLLIIGLGGLLGALPINPFFAILIGIFGVFLLIQTYTLRLEFASEAMVVWQVGRELRRFPYKNWLAWRLLIPSLPGIFYFREVASPHLLPIIFDKNALENQLRLRLKDLEKPKTPDKSVS